jgi:hypothetical protein
MEPIELKAAYCQRFHVFEWEGHIYAQLKELRITPSTQMIPVVELDGLDFYRGNSDEGLVAFLALDENGAHAQGLTAQGLIAQVLIMDGSLVRRGVREIALRIELKPTTFSTLAHLKRNGSNHG